MRTRGLYHVGEGSCESHKPWPGIAQRARVRLALFFRPASPAVNRSHKSCGRPKAARLRDGCSTREPSKTRRGSGRRRRRPRLSLCPSGRASCLLLVESHDRPMTGRQRCTLLRRCASTMRRRRSAGPGRPSASASAVAGSMMGRAGGGPGGQRGKKKKKKMDPFGGSWGCWTSWWLH